MKKDVGYIAGFVVKMLQKLIKYDICLEKCLDVSGLPLGLFDLKQRGPLLRPSKDVIKICATTENVCHTIQLVLFDVTKLHCISIKTKKFVKT